MKGSRLLTLGAAMAALAVPAASVAGAQGITPIASGGGGPMITPIASGGGGPGITPIVNGGEFQARPVHRFAGRHGGKPGRHRFHDGFRDGKHGRHRFHRGFRGGLGGVWIVEREVVQIVEVEVPVAAPPPVAPPPPPPPRKPYVIGNSYSSLPDGCMKLIEGSTSYYHCDGEWYRQAGSRYVAVAARL